MGQKLAGTWSWIQIQCGMNETLLRQPQLIRTSKVYFTDEKTVGQGHMVMTHHEVTRMVSTQTFTSMEMTDGSWFIVCLERWGPDVD